MHKDEALACEEERERGRSGREEAERVCERGERERERERDRG